MNTLIDEMLAYLQQIVGLKADVQLVPKGKAPVFISEAYSFCKIRAGNAKFLGVILHDPESFRPSSLEKHKRFFPFDEREQLHEPILIASALSGYIRKRLIELRISFVVPKVQMYWPELGMEFRSHVQSKFTSLETNEKFDPSAQAVLIGALNKSYHQPITPKELSQRLYYSAMSMTCALDQIELAGIGHIKKSGKQRFLSFSEDEESLWRKVKDKLNNPVREKARFLEEDVPRDYKLLAGESALSEMSALVAPQTPTYAVSREKWKRIVKKAIPHLEIKEHGTCEVQVWRYDPELFSNRKCVDVFSLYLSMENIKDERVQMALDEALKERL